MKRYNPSSSQHLKLRNYVGEIKKYIIEENKDYQHVSAKDLELVRKMWNNTLDNMEERNED